MPHSSDDDADDPGEDREEYTEYDPEEPETFPEGLYADDSPAVISCPYCKAQILEDSERCPRCENYLSREDAPSTPKSPLWVILMALALLAALILALLQ